jgi:exodeoxyribonuclease-1
MYIFYDLETTGTDLVFDQILQFAAILVDASLVEHGRFERRCRILPWIVPAPGALLVTATDVDRLEDPTLSDFYSMMNEIGECIGKWGPATFVGYNSIRFDEPLLQRGFWQALLPPYQTVTGGNARLDLLPMMRAAACFRPDLVALPRRTDGLPSFRLDALAPANGFNAHHAHDAMGDVEATLYLARKLKAGFPELWDPLTSRASKAATAALLESGEPLFLFHHGAEPTARCYFRVDRGATRQSYAIMASLGFDWICAGDPSADSLPSMRSALRRIALNKAPLVLTLAEAEAVAGIVPSQSELEQARFLHDKAQYCEVLANIIKPFSSATAKDGAQVEELIFDGFAESQDEKLMVEFRQASNASKLAIAQAFKDSRFSRLAMRILYVQAPETLRERDREVVEAGIVRRLCGDNDGRQPWRSVSDALAELNSLPEPAFAIERKRIGAWLEDRLSATFLAYGRSPAADLVKLDWPDVPSDTSK